MSFDITDCSPQRLDVGIQLLLEGQPVESHGVHIYIRGGTVHVGAHSTWAPENVTEQYAREDVERAASVFRALLAARPDFAAHIRSLPVRYGVGYPIGQGEVAICESDGVTVRLDPYLAHYNDNSRNA